MFRFGSGKTSSVIDCRTETEGTVYIQLYTAVSKNVVGRKAKSLSQDRKVIWDFYNDKQRSYRSFAATQWPWEQYGTSFCKPWEYSVGQLLKQRQWRQKRPWTTIGLNEQNNNFICTCITLFVRGRCCTATAWNVSISSFRGEVNSRPNFLFTFFFLT